MDFLWFSFGFANLNLFLTSYAHSLACAHTGWVLKTGLESKNIYFPEHDNPQISFNRICSHNGMHTRGSGQIKGGQAITRLSGSITQIFNIRQLAFWGFLQICIVSACRLITKWRPKSFKAKMGTFFASLFKPTLFPIQMHICSRCPTPLQFLIIWKVNFCNIITSCC